MIFFKENIAMLKRLSNGDEERLPQGLIDPEFPKKVDLHYSVCLAVKRIH